MKYPGTISLRQETFEALLTDICGSLRQHGFRTIFLIGDSGGNQEGMANVAAALNVEWRDDPARVHYIPEYYTGDAWSYEHLKRIGYTQLPDKPDTFRNNIHTDLHYESIMAVVDPQLVRAHVRFRNGKYEVHGVEIGSPAELIELGKKLAEYRAEITVKAMKQAAAE